MEGLICCIRINVVFIFLSILGCQSIGSGGLLRCIRINVVFISLQILGCQSVGRGRLVTLY